MFKKAVISVCLFGVGAYAQKKYGIVERATKAYNEAKKYFQSIKIETPEAPANDQPTEE